MNASASLSPATSSPASELAALDDPQELGRFTRWVEDAHGRRTGESSFQLGGMYCAACAGLIETAFLSVPGVKSAQVSSASQRALVAWDPQMASAAEMVAAVRRAGYDAVPDSAAPARELRRRERRKALWRLFVASFAAMQVMMFATPSYMNPGADFTMDLRQLLNWGSWLVALPVLVFSAGPFFSGAWRSLQTRRISMDVPVAVGLLVTFVASMGATFDPAGPFGHEVYFDSFTMFVSFLLAGRYLEMNSRHKAAESLEAALAALPEVAHRLLPDGSVEDVSVARLRQGDRVRVPLGSAFPADGLLEAGQTSANESLLTGESTPVRKLTGDFLVGGSVNLGEPVVMQVLRVGKDTRYESIVSLMRDALTQRPQLASQADAWAGPFLWGVLALATLAAIGWSFVDPAKAVWVAVSVLIVTCPCALSLAVPSAMVSAAGALAKRGVMLQRLDALESFASIGKLFIDKTGTLTESRGMLVEPVSLATTNSGSEDRRHAADMSSPSREECLAAAKALAAWSQHPLSRAVAAAQWPEIGARNGSPNQSEDETADPANAGQAHPSVGWHSIREQAGQGLEGQGPDGSNWRLGSWAWVNQFSEAQASTSKPSVSAHLYLGKSGKALLGFQVEEVLRADAVDALGQLKADGVKVCLLSGDAHERAERVAQRLGIDETISTATPEDKLAAVAAAQAAGNVVGMVGDGVNDAPVLARADVSFAMGEGALVSRVHADAVILSNRLLDLVWALRLAKRAMLAVRQNLLWAAVYNASCIPLALAGFLPPWAAGLGMALSSMFVIINSLRLAR